MPKKLHAAARCFGVGLLAAWFAAAACAQTLSEKPGGKPASAPSADVALSAQLVKTGLYLIQGGGGNSLLRLSANGSILVDSKLPGSYRALRSQIRKISKLSDLPARVLVVTNHHADHAGNSRAFLADGVAVIAQDHAKARLMDGQQPTAAPLIGYDHDYTLRLGGVEVQVMHFGSAQTDGDAVVFFPNLKVVAVGDLYSPAAPEPDFAAGGSLVGWGAVLEQVLKLDFDVVVPSQGPAVSRADLEAFKAKVDALAARATALAQAGTSKGRFIEQLKADDLGWHLDFTGEQLDGLYADSARGR